MQYFLSLQDETMFPHPKDDYFASLRMATHGASILSPLPGLAAHVENYEGYVDEGERSSESGYVGLYNDWFAFGKGLVDYGRSQVEATKILSEDQVSYVVVGN